MSIDPIRLGEPPTKQPLLLVATNVITRNPETGEAGEWTFLHADDNGLTVRLHCIDSEGDPVLFGVERSSRIHVADHNTNDFWGDL